MYSLIPVEVSQSKKFTSLHSLLEHTHIGSSQFVHQALHVPKDIWVSAATDAPKKTSLTLKNISKNCCCFSSFYQNIQTTFNFNLFYVNERTQMNQMNHFCLTLHPCTAVAMHHLLWSGETTFTAEICYLLSSLLVVVERKMLRKVLHFYCLILWLVFLLCTSPFFLFNFFSLHNFFNHHWQSCSLAGFYVYAWNGHWMWLCPVGAMGSDVEAMVLSQFSSWKSR